jgi:predicted lipoprotein with Yx(FWY)xxD motif
MKKHFFLLLLLSFVFINSVNSSISAHSTSSNNEITSQKENYDTSNQEDERDRLQVLKSDKVGKYLADSQGMTLYYFKKDEPGVSNCKDKCSEIWPPFYAENIKTSKGFKERDFGTITREDGQKQTTYKGHPLYYFSNDQKVGDINGQGVKNVWFVVNKNSFED